MFVSAKSRIVYPSGTDSPGKSWLDKGHKTVVVVVVVVSQYCTSQDIGLEDRFKMTYFVSREMYNFTQCQFNTVDWVFIKDICPVKTMLQQIHGFPGDCEILIILSVTILKRTFNLIHNSVVFRVWLNSGGS